MKLRVHNLFEAKALIKEAIQRGDDCYDLVIINHQGQYLGTNRDSDKIAIFFDVDDQESVGA